MLVMSRKKNECIIIDNVIRVTVVEIRDDRVRLAIDAPMEMPVHRKEVFEAIHGLGPSQPTAVPQQVRAVEISVSQLVHDLGAADAEVDRKIRFTSEGGLAP
jgi:carbon storage regulator